MNKKSFSLSLSELFRPSSSSWAYFRHIPTLPAGDVVLRPIRRGDAGDIFEYCSDPDVARYVLWEPYTSISDARNYISWIRRSYRSGLPSSWAVTLASTGKVIGTIGIMWYSSENLSAEIGYSLSRSFWNKGYASQALSAVIGSLFRDLGLNRIEGQCDTRNPASGRVMEKCGMKKEGILRQRIKNKGEFIDVALYSILRSDLPNRDDRPAASEIP